MARDPWARPRFLAAATWIYLVWSLVPVLIAVLLSFNAGRSNSTFQGFGTEWWFGAPQGDAQGSLFTSPDLRGAIVQTLVLSVLTMAIAVPLGTAFAIGLDRWRGRAARGANLAMLASFVMPEIVLAVAFLYLVQYVYAFVPLGTVSQVLALVTLQVSLPFILVRARLLALGPEYEEAALDLGAPPRDSLRRVLLPLLAPAILASLALVFANTVDDFVTVSDLSAGAGTQPLSVKIYVSVRAAPTPAVNAAATFMLVTTTLVIGAGYALSRRLGRGQRTSVTDFASAR
ncbi:MAG: ABC transporter permease [Actinomycetota bacterium]